MMNEVYIKLSPVDGHRIACGRSIINTRQASREVAREILHELVEQILDRLYLPPPREAAEETIINEIRKGKLRLCK